MDQKKEEALREEAKQIMKKFSKALDSVKLGKKPMKKDVGGFRDEGNGMRIDDDFRKRMFNNASDKDENCIFVEKKEWS